MEDISDRCEEYFYEYNPEKGFDYSEFERLSTAIMQEFFEPLHEAETSDGVWSSVCLQEDEYIEEIHAMFHRMGIPKLDGCKGFAFMKPMGYIDARITWEEKIGDRVVTREGIIALDLLGKMCIYPKGLKIIA